MGKTRYGVDWVEVRFAIKKKDDPVLFNAMKEFPEVHWGVVCKEKIIQYIKDRKKN